MKRILKTFRSVIAILLISCFLAGCSSPVISDKVMNSLFGAYQYADNLIKQIKEEGLGSIASIFKNDDDDEQSSSTPNASNDSEKNEESNDADSEALGDQTSDGSSSER